MAISFEECSLLFWRPLALDVWKVHDCLGMQLQASRAFHGLGRLQLERWSAGALERSGAQVLGRSSKCSSAGALKRMTTRALEYTSSRALTSKFSNAAPHLWALHLTQADWTICHKERNESQCEKDSGRGMLPHNDAVTQPSSAPLSSDSNLVAAMI